MMAARLLVRTGCEMSRKGYVEERVAIEEDRWNASISMSPPPTVRLRGRLVVIAFILLCSAMGCPSLSILHHHELKMTTTAPVYSQWASSGPSGMVTSSMPFPVILRWPMAESFFSIFSMEMAEIGKIQEH